MAANWRDTDTLTPAEVAEWLHVTPRLVKELAARGAIPAFRVGVQWRFLFGQLREHFGACASSALVKSASFTAKLPGHLSGGSGSAIRPADAFDSLLAKSTGRGPRSTGANSPSV